MTSSVAIVGGGPAGMVLGLLLARVGVTVTVLEKYPDFLRDFRGDTVHPPTMRLLDDLGLGDAFRRLPAGRMTSMRMRIGRRDVTMGNLATMPGRYRHSAMVPQWDLLDLLADSARQEPTFTLRMSADVTGLTRNPHGRVDGLTWRDADGDHHLPADLVVGCDGRWSVVRREAGLALVESDLPMDVWWVRVPMAPGDDDGNVVARFVDGHVVVSMARHDYHQVAYLLAKGTDAERRREPVESLRQVLGDQFGWSPEQLAGIRSWDDVKFLDARAGMLTRWWAPGVLCIGDAAHPMSPVMGVGINLAVQDAVATARILGPRLRSGDLADRDLARVERRRRLPTRLTRAMQDNEHDHLVRPALEHRINDLPLPGFVRVMQISPRLSGLLTWAQASALGHERTPHAARRRVTRGPGGSRRRRAPHPSTGRPRGEPLELSTPVGGGRSPVGRSHDHHRADLVAVSGQVSRPPLGSSHWPLTGLPTQLSVTSRPEPHSQSLRGHAYWVMLASACPEFTEWRESDRGLPAQLPVTPGPGPTFQSLRSSLPVNQCTAAAVPAMTTRGYGTRRERRPRSTAPSSHHEKRNIP